MLGWQDQFRDKIYIHPLGPLSCSSLQLHFLKVSEVCNRVLKQLQWANNYFYYKTVL